VTKEDKAEHFAFAWRVVLGIDAPTFEREYVFHPTRKWRFDFAFPFQKIAVEVEGNAWSVKGGGRHMQDGDLEKYNAAAKLGWRVFRFSPKMLKDDPAQAVRLVLDTVLDVMD